MLRFGNSWKFCIIHIIFQFNDSEIILNEIGIIGFKIGNNENNLRYNTNLQNITIIKYNSTFLQHRKLDLDQMKGDLACVIQDKLALEERLQKNNEMLKALQAVSQSIFSRSNTYEKTRILQSPNRAFNEYFNFIEPW